MCPFYEDLQSHRESHKISQKWIDLSQEYQFHNYGLNLNINLILCSMYDAGAFKGFFKGML